MGVDSRWRYGGWRFTNRYFDKITTTFITGSRVSVRAKFLDLQDRTVPSGIKSILGSHPPYGDTFTGELWM